MKYKLKDIIKFKPGYAFKTSQMNNKGLNLIKIKSMKDNKIIFDKDTVKIQETESLKDYIIRKNDILMALTGDPINKGSYETWVGRTSRYTYNYNSYLNQRICKLIPNEEIINSDYLYYWLIDYNKTFEIASLCRGSANQANISHKDVGEMSIELPELSEQIKIGNILTNIDNKIIINNQTNDNLYKLMQIKFEDWITNLSKYEVSSLSKIANYTNGLAMQKFRPKDNEESLPVIKIKEMNDGITENTERCSTNIKDEVIINNGDVLFAWSGTLCMSIWGKGKAGLNQHIFKVTSDKYPKWFYYFWTLQHLNKFKMIAAGKATTMGHIKRGELDVSEVLIPEDRELQEMHKIMQPLFEKYINNLIQNETLTELRDTLLPKLMNGEIDLDNIELENING